MKFVLGFLLSLVLAAPAMALGPANCLTTTPHANVVAGTSYTISQLDACNVLVFTSGSAVAVTLPAPGTGGDFIAPFNVTVYAKGAGTVTVTPAAGGGATPTINATTSAAATTGTSLYIVQDTTGNWWAVP